MIIPVVHYKAVLMADANATKANAQLRLVLKGDEHALIIINVKLLKLHAMLFA